MTFLAKVQPSFQSVGVSQRGWPISPRDRDVVANVIAGTDWSVHHHEAPDHETSLIVLPNQDERLPSFILSAAGSRFCLQECRNDVLYRLGEFGALAEAATALRGAISGQTG